MKTRTIGQCRECKYFNFRCDNPKTIAFYVYMWKNKDFYCQYWKEKKK